MAIQQGNTTSGPLPAVMANPVGLKGVVRRKKKIERARGAMPPGTRVAEKLAVASQLPVHVQLGRDHLDGIRDEIGAAEPVLSNVYEDIELFRVRQGALNEITLLLSSMRDGVDTVIRKPSKRTALRNEIDGLLATMEHLVSSTKYRSIPLLEPSKRIAPYPVGGTRDNRADIIFLVDRDRWMKKDVKGLARNAHVMNSVLANSGVDARFGVQPFGRVSQPTGPLRQDVEDFAADLEAIYFNGKVKNALTAIGQALREQSFREDSRRIIVVFSDGEAHDDYGSAREDIIDELRSGGATLFYIGSNDRLTGYPFGVYDELAERTGGACYNFESNTLDEVMTSLADGIISCMVDRGASLYESMERVLPIGPGAGDTVTAHFPDFRPGSLGLSDLPLENEADYREAIRVIQGALDTVVRDRRDKTILQDFLERILRVFDELRDYRLDFQV